MTFIGTVGFPDEVLILSDSRRSYKNNVLPPMDDIKKIYQLSHHLCLGFTTEDIQFTTKLIASITIFSKNKQHMTTGKFLNEVTTFAKVEYEQLARKENKSPIIIFVYAGIDEKPLKVPRNKALLLLRRIEGEGYIPEKIKKIKIVETDKYVDLPAPTPILVKQKFPEGRVSSSRGWDFTVVGSGWGLEKEIEKFYAKFFFFPGSFNKGVILNDLCTDFISKSKIDSIGGTIQVFVIDKDGVRPVEYIAKSGNQVETKKYIDSSGDWIEEKGMNIVKIKQNP